MPVAVTGRRTGQHEQPVWAAVSRRASGRGPSAHRVRSAPCPEPGDGRTRDGRTGDRLDRRPAGPETGWGAGEGDDAFQASPTGRGGGRSFHLSSEDALMINIHNLQVYDVSLQAFSAVNKALDTVPDRSGPGYLVNQCRRATSSVVSNIAEGAGRLHGDRAHLLLAVPNLPASPPGRVPRPCREAEGGQLSAHSAAAPGPRDPRRRRARRGAPRSDPGDALAVGSVRGIGGRRRRGVGARRGRRVSDWRTPVVLRCMHRGEPLRPALPAGRRLWPVREAAPG